MWAARSPSVVGPGYLHKMFVEEVEFFVVVQLKILYIWREVTVFCVNIVPVLLSGVQRWSMASSTTTYQEVGLCVVGRESNCEVAEWAAEKCFRNRVLMSRRISVQWFGIITVNISDGTDRKIIFQVLLDGHRWIKNKILIKHSWKYKFQYTKIQYPVQFQLDHYKFQYTVSVSFSVYSKVGSV